MIGIVRLVVVGSAAALALASASCARDDAWTPPALTLDGKPVAPEVLRAGRRVYREHCIGCHGEHGDGQGKAARFLDPTPRDFTKGIFKFAAVPAGSLPHDGDLDRTLAHGLRGTAMPSWRLLPAADRAAVITYLKTFSPRWSGETPDEAIAPGPDPFAADPARGVAMGKRVYHGRAQCWTCHPAYATYDEMREIARSYDLPPPSFRPDLYDAAAKTTDSGERIVPPDFLRRAPKAGGQVADLRRVIGAGVGGTAMPTWHGSLPEDDLWAMAHYVHALVTQRQTPAALSLRAALLAQPPLSRDGGAP